MKENDSPRSDIEEIRREETRRGKRPINIEERKRRQQLEKFLRTATENDLKDAMRALGLKDGSERFEAALEIWHSRQ